MSEDDYSDESFESFTNEQESITSIVSNSFNETKSHEGNAKSKLLTSCASCQVKSLRCNMPQQTDQAEMCCKESQFSNGDDDCRFHMFLEICQKGELSKLRKYFDRYRWNYTNRQRVYSCLRRGEILVQSIEEESYYRRKYSNFYTSSENLSKNEGGEKLVKYENYELVQLLDDMHLVDIVTDTSGDNINYVTVYSRHAVTEEGDNMKTTSLIVVWWENYISPFTILSFIGTPRAVRLFREIIICGTSDGILYVWDLRNHEKTRYLSNERSASKSHQQVMYPSLSYGIDVNDLDAICCSAIVDILIVHKDIISNATSCEVVVVDENGTFFIWELSEKGGKGVSSQISLQLLRSLQLLSDENESNESFFFRAVPLRKSIGDLDETISSNLNVIGLALSPTSLGDRCLISLSSGKILDISFGVDRSLKTFIRSSTLVASCQSYAVSIVFSPFAKEMFLVSWSNGDVSLFTERSSTPIESWNEELQVTSSISQQQNIFDNQLLKYVAWSMSSPCRFYCFCGLKLLKCDVESYPMKVTEVAWSDSNCDLTTGNIRFTTVKGSLVITNGSLMTEIVVDEPYAPQSNKESINLQISKLRSFRTLEPLL